MRALFSLPAAALFLAALVACTPASPAPAADAADASAATDDTPDTGFPAEPDRSPAPARVPEPIETPACGAFEQPCCLDGPACEPGLSCAPESNHCLAPRAPHCVAEGIAEPTFASASFGLTPLGECTMVPDALRTYGDGVTRGAYPEPTRRAGYLACSGLTPGRATIRLRARVRMIEPDCQVHRSACCCESVATADLAVQMLPGPRYQFTKRNGDPARYGCTDGPDFDWSQAVLVPPDGRLSARIDVLRCDRAGYTECLFLRGSSLELTQEPAARP